jgi:hypothetical protein
MEESDRLHSRVAEGEITSTVVVLEDVAVELERMVDLLGSNKTLTRIAGLASPY